jgi:hypothetical protein
MVLYFLLMSTWLFSAMAHPVPYQAEYTEGRAVAIVNSVSITQEHVHSGGTNTVEHNSRTEIVLNSFCYAALGEDLEPTLMCRWDTPEFIMRLHGYKPTKRV